MNACLNRVGCNSPPAVHIDTVSVSICVCLSVCVCASDGISLSLSHLSWSQLLTCTWYPSPASRASNRPVSTASASRAPAPCTCDPDWICCSPYTWPAHPQKINQKRIQNNESHYCEVCVCMRSECRYLLQTNQEAVVGHEQQTFSIEL